MAYTSRLRKERWSSGSQASSSTTCPNQGATFSERERDEQQRKGEQQDL